MTLRNRPFENIVGKGENADSQHFLLFSQCLLCPKTNFNFSIIIIVSANSFNLDQSKNLSFGKELSLECQSKVMHRVPITILDKAVCSGLTWAKAFRYQSIFCLLIDKSTSLCSHSLGKMDFMGPLLFYGFLTLYQTF